MLKLKNLEISGFKSFVDPVETDFADGITAIVGPNGCGKSNFSEAITWVLGEQSAKSLRGGKMEDVIFNGTDRRKPLGMAEVNLTLETDEDIEGAENGQLIIGRRVFRSGESQYRLNDKIVRLKEIKDILADTGLGVRAYSVIEQGRIGQILSSKPIERRKLIEEAAGVTRYKARKRLAELKLEDATANRMRLDDIISEVERALRSLKRQSNAARRFKKREGQYRELQRTVLTARYSALQVQLQELQTKITQGNDGEAALGAALSTAEAELAAAREKLDELTREIARRHQRTAELGARIEGRQEFIRGTRATVEQIDERIENGIRIADQRQGQMKEHLEALVSLDQKKQTLLQDRSSAQKLVDDGAARLQHADEQLAAAQSREGEVRQELAQSAQQVGTAQQQLQRNQIDLEKAQFRLERSEKATAEKATELEQAKAKLAEATAQTEELEKKADDLGSQLGELKQKLEDTVQKEGHCSETCEALRMEDAQLSQRKALLDELAQADEERRADVREAMDDLGLSNGEPLFLDERLAAAESSAAADERSIPAGYEASIDALLEPIRDAVVVSDDEDALRVARELAERGVDAAVLRPRSISDRTHDAYAPLRKTQGAQKRRTRTETRRVPVQRTIEKTIEETVEVPVEIDVPVEVEVPIEVPLDVAPPAEQAETHAASSAPAAPAKRSWIDVLLSPFRRTAKDKSPSHELPTAERQSAKSESPPATRIEMRTETRIEKRVEMRTETRPRVVTETVTEYEDQEVEVEIDDDQEAASADTGGAWIDGVIAALPDVLALDTDLSHALPLAVLAQSAEDAGRLAAIHPQFAFLAPGGTVVHAGLVRIASKSAAPGAMARFTEMDEVASRLPRIASELETVREELQSLVAARTERAAEVGRQSAALDDLKQKLAVATARRQDQKHQVERVEAEQRGIAEEQTEIQELIESVSAARKELDAEFSEVSEAHAALQKKLEDAQAEVAKARDLRQEVRTEGEGRKSNLRLLEERVESHHQETTRLQRLSEEVRDFLLRWAEDRTNLTTRQEKLKTEVEEARVELQRALEERTDAEEQKRAVQEALDAQRQAVKTLEQAVTAKRDERDAARSKVQEMRVSEAQRTQQIEGVQETFEKEFGARLDTEGELPPAPENLDDLVTELDQLKQIMDRMGPVNVLAAEEYAEQEERYEFLTVQRADVQKSIESLRKTIKEINETSITRFLETFNQVNKFFGESFTKLFRGGEASMRLLDDDEPLDSGIEIVARPPGKRLQNIQLLSGGEKALTAIALLFALFRHKPSPFCVLDEVDAPLDDANVMRFIETLQEMAKDTQFLLVTHNKLSMEAASTLYGVTMAEKGVSKLVGVNIDELHPPQRLAS